MIEYLLKFTTKQEYANQLLKGQLFMRPASFYWGLEKGQGDLHEAAVSPISQIYKNPNFAIYCFSHVDDNNIEDGKIEIDKKLVDDCAKNGFVTIIDYKKFEDILFRSDFGGYRLLKDKVEYKKFGLYDIPILLDSNENIQLFIKNPSFSYQKEYRLVVTYAIDDIFETKIRNGSSYLQRVDSGNKTFYLQDNLYSIAKTITISELERNKAGNYLLSIPQELL